MPALTSRRERSALTGRNNLSSMNSTASNSINSTPRDMPSIRPSTSANLPLSISPVKVNTSDRPQTQASTRLTSSRDGANQSTLPDVSPRNRPATTQSNSTAMMNSRTSSSPLLTSSMNIENNRPFTQPADSSNNTVGSFDNSVELKKSFTSTGTLYDNSATIDDLYNRLKQKSYALTAANYDTIEDIGQYNTFSQTRLSKVNPLRSVLLDPEVNNLPPSKTRTELLSKIHTRLIPHPTYDLNRDGYVSQQDYKIAKRFDIDCNGIIDDDERELAHRVLVEEFFKDKSADELKLYDVEFAKNTHRTNVNKMLASHNIEKDLDRLREIDRAYTLKGSRQIQKCLTLVDKSLIKHNFFTNKFDTTAWNDFDAIPRSESNYASPVKTMTSSSPSITGRGVTLQGSSPRLGTSPAALTGSFTGSWSSSGFAPSMSYEHGGSRKRLMFTRKQESRETSQYNMIAGFEARGKGLEQTINNRRVNLITDPAVENS